MSTKGEAFGEVVRRHQRLLRVQDRKQALFLRALALGCEKAPTCPDAGMCAGGRADALVAEWEKLDREAGS